MRALAIAFFYAIGTGIGGIAGPWLFGVLIDTGSRMSVFGGYLLGAALMMAAGLIAALFACPPSESRSRRWRGRWRSSTSGDHSSNDRVDPVAVALLVQDGVAPIVVAALVARLVLHPERRRRPPRSAIGEPFHAGCRLPLAHGLGLLVADAEDVFARVRSTATCCAVHSACRRRAAPAHCRSD